MPTPLPDVGATRAAGPLGLDLPGLPALGRTRVMGVVNVTPDSFSDGGLHLALDDAVDHGRRLVDDGADLLDVGGESTRPGAGRVPVEEELRRVVPVVEVLAAEGHRVSVDTTRAVVAAAALDAGAVLVNDVSAGRGDPAMLPLVADRGVTYLAMHGRGPSLQMQQRAAYDDVVAEVVAELAAAADACEAAGVRRGALLLDPGLGFAKEPVHNWALLRGWEALAALGRPLVLGASRKRFLGELLPGPDGAPRPPAGRDAATAALSTLAASWGAWAVRVHDVRSSVDAVRVVARLGAST